MLDRYFEVLEGKVFARHQISRAVSVKESLEGRALGDLWELHRQKIGEYRKLLVEGVPGSETSEEEGTNLLDLKLLIAEEMLSACAFCERRCGADRREDETGFCGVRAKSRYASQFLHMGEETELIPSHTIFFSGCTFHCVYCQNWDIAMHPDSGRVAEPERLVELIREGAAQGSRNVNFVGGNPDPNLHTILATVKDLGKESQNLPMVWNSNMYTSLEALELLEGVIDVYLGDFRYGSDRCAHELSDVDSYFETVTRNFSLAHEQAEVMLRHLVLPGHLECCSRPIMEWVSKNIPEVYFNLMFQYRPEFRASLFPSLDRRLTHDWSCPISSQA